MERLLAWVGLAIALASATGCGYDISRYSHFGRGITSPVRSAPMSRRSEVEAHATAQPMGTSPEPRADGDASLVVPELVLGLGPRFALTDALHIGAHFEAAFAAFAAGTHDDTPTPENGDLVVFSFGPDFGFTLPIGDSVLSWGAFINATLSVGWVIGEQSDGSVIDILRLMVFYRAGLALHLFPEEPVSGELGVTLQNYLTGDVLGHFSLNRHGVVPYVGVRVRSDHALYFYAQLHFPLGFEYTNAWPLAGVFGVGVALGDDPRG